MYADFTISIYAMGALMAIIGLVIFVKQFKQRRQESTKFTRRRKTK